MMVEYGFQRNKEDVEKIRNKQLDQEILKKRIEIIT